MCTVILTSNSGLSAHHESPTSVPIGGVAAGIAIAVPFTIAIHPTSSTVIGINCESLKSFKALPSMKFFFVEKKSKTLRPFSDCWGFPEVKPNHQIISVQFSL